jgi:DNA polymerase III delta prime subunit
MIKERLDLEIVNITENLSFDFIMQLQQKPEPYIYVINIDDITIKEQNIILKFVEEPLKNSYIVLLSESVTQILPTIYNRCQVLNFLPYDKETLLKFTNNELILSIAKTPGQVIEMESVEVTPMWELANKIVTKIGVANVPNVLTISDKISFKSEKDKINLSLFYNVLVYIIKQTIMEDKQNMRLFHLYQSVQDWNRERRAPTIQQKYLFEHYLLRWHYLMRG